jgi:hypothetical protein
MWSVFTGDEDGEVARLLPRDRNACQADVAVGQMVEDNLLHGRMLRVGAVPEQYQGRLG